MEKASFVHQIMSHASRPERRWRYWRRDSIVLIWKLLLPVKFFPIVQLTFAVFPFSISLCSIRNPPRGSVPYKSKFSFFLCNFSSHKLSIVFFLLNLFLWSAWCMFWIVYFMYFYLSFLLSQITKKCCIWKRMPYHTMYRIMFM